MGTLTPTTYLNEYAKLDADYVGCEKEDKCCLCIPITFGMKLSVGFTILQFVNAFIINIVKYVYLLDLANLKVPAPFDSDPLTGTCVTNYKDY